MKKKSDVEKFNAVMPDGVSFGNRGFNKQANTQTFMTNVDDVSRTPLLYVDPLWDSILLMFPEDNLKEVNKRLRHYYKYQPVFGNCVDVHSTFPMSDFEIMVDEDSLKEYYTFLKDKYSLVKMGEWLLRDRTLLGEALFVGNWDKYNYEWKEWVQYPPEYVDIRRVPGTNSRMIRLLPDPDLQKIANSNSQEDLLLAQVASQYNPKYYEMASSNESYPVSEDRTIHFANQPSGYTLRGYSLGKRVLKDLLYEDKLRMLQYTFVDRHMYPLKIFKLGSREKGWIPGQSHFTNFKKLLIQAANDPDFCHDENTEVLTERGFLKHEEIKESDKLATIDPNSGKLTFVNYVRKIVYDFPKKYNTELLGGEKEKIEELLKKIKGKPNRKNIEELSLAYEKFSLGASREFLSGLEKLRDIESVKHAGGKYWKEIKVVSPLLAKTLFGITRKACFCSRLNEKKDNWELHWLPEDNGEMIHFNSESLDALVTPNHRMLVKDVNTEKWIQKRADEVRSGDKFTTVCSEYDGEYPEFFKDNKLNINGLDFEIDDFLRLFGMIFTEGYASQNGRSISFSQSKDSNFSRNKDEFNYFAKALVEKLGFLDWRVDERKRDVEIWNKINKNTRIDYTIKNSSLCKWFAENCGKGAQNKKIPQWIKNLPKKHLMVLMDILLLGDGCKNQPVKKNPEYTQIRFWTTSSQTAADIQEIAFKIGWSSNCRFKNDNPHPRDPNKFGEIYIISMGPVLEGMKKRVNPQIKNDHISKEKYNGKVFCYDVPPNHTMVTRRNGKILVSYNSIIYHFGLEVEYVGTKDKIENLIPHFEFIQKRILVGMFANDALISGESPGYSSQTVNLRMLFHRYLTVRQDLQDTYKYKMYLPIARSQKFVRQTNANNKNSIKIYSKNFPLKKYYLPDFLWRKLNLLNNTSEQEFLLRLYEKGDLPFTVISDVFGYDNKILEKYWNSERGTMVDKNYRSIIENKIEKEPEFAKGYFEGKDPKTLNREISKEEVIDFGKVKKKEKGEGSSFEGIAPKSEPVTEESEEIKSPPGSEGEGSPI